MQHPGNSHPPNVPTACLHLVAAAGRDVLDACLAQVSAGDHVVFLDAGVLQLLQSPATLATAADGVSFAATDLRAHGLLDAAREARVDVVDDAGICALLARCRHSLTWR
jgi:sulfur relay protein TusB/DsrH